jgi:uncharacterized membrane protein YtjA (UPF0391 family)
MLIRWAIIFAVIALVAALLGFWGVAAIGLQVAEILLVVFVILLLVSLIFGRRVL